MQNGSARVQEVTWEGTLESGNCTLFCEESNGNHQLTGVIHRQIRSAVKSVELSIKII